MSSVSVPFKIVDSGDLEKLKGYIRRNRLKGNNAGANYYDAKCGMHILTRAVSNDDVEVVECLLKKGALPNAQSKVLGLTALIYAAKFGKPDSARFLIVRSKEFKVDISICDCCKGWNALMHCCASESKDMAVDVQTAELLIQKIKKKDLDMQDKDGSTAQHIAIRSRATEIVFMLIDSGMCNLTLLDCEKNSPLILASDMGLTKVTQALLRHHEVLRLINHENSDGDTALTAAAASGTLSQVKLLLNAGAKISHENLRRETALDLAVRLKRQEIANYLKSLLKKSRSKENTQRSQQCSTRLSDEANSGGAEIVLDSSRRSDSEIFGELKLLIQKTSDRKACLHEIKRLLNILQSRNALSEKLLADLLKTAMDSEFHAVIAHLVAVGANIDRTDENGLTALHHAVLAGSCATTQKLLNLNADPNIQENVDGFTPLMMCINEIDKCQQEREDKKIRKVGRNEKCLIEVAKLLLQPSFCLSARCQPYNDTVVHLAVRIDKRYFVQQLLRQNAKDALLCTNSHSRTPLMLAARFNCHQALEGILRKINNEVTKKPLQQQANERRSYMEAIDMNGNTAFTLAAKFGDLSAVMLLADAGADLRHKNAQNEDAIKLSSDVRVKEFLERRLQSIGRYPFSMLGSRHPGTCIYIAADPSGDRSSAMGYDENSLRELFQTKLGYKFSPYTNLTAKKIQELMHDLQEKDFSSSASLLLFVSSHGISDKQTNKDYFVGMSPISPRTESAGKRLISLENFSRPIANNRSLKGKPKVLVYQMCRTQKPDLRLHSIKTSVTEWQPNQRHAADMLELFATSPGDAAFKNDRGTLFLQEFCQDMIEYMGTDHLMDIINRLSDRLSKIPIKTERNGEEVNYQTVQIKGHLPKRVYFYP